MMRWTCVCGAPVWPNCLGLPCTGNQLPKWAGGARTSTGLGPKGALQTLEEVWELPGKLETLCFPIPQPCRDPERSLGDFLSGKSRVSEDHRGCVPCCTSCCNESHVQTSSVCCYGNHLAHSMSYRLAVTYSQTGVRGVFRSLIRGLTNLRENIWSWRVLTPGTWVRALTPLVHCMCCLVCQCPPLSRASFHFCPIPEALVCAATADWLLNSRRFKYTLNSAFRSLLQGSFLWQTGPSLSHGLSAMPAPLLTSTGLNAHVHTVTQDPHLCLVPVLILPFLLVPQVSPDQARGQLFPMVLLVLLLLGEALHLQLQ